MVDPHEHRSFKSKISSLFSARSTAAVAPRLLVELQKVAARLQIDIGRDDTVNIQKLVRTLTVGNAAFKTSDRNTDEESPIWLCIPSSPPTWTFSTLNLSIIHF